MPNTDLSVTIEADTTDAVEAINKVTEAVEELNEALNKLEKAPLTLEIDTVGQVSNTQLEYGFDNSMSETFEVTN